MNSDTKKVIKPNPIRKMGGKKWHCKK